METTNQAKIIKANTLEILPLFILPIIFLKSPFMSCHHHMHLPIFLAVHSIQSTTAFTFTTNSIELKIFEHLKRINNNIENPFTSATTSIKTSNITNNGCDGNSSLLTCTVVNDPAKPSSKELIKDQTNKDVEVNILNKILSPNKSTTLPNVEYMLEARELRKFNLGGKMELMKELKNNRPTIATKNEPELNLREWLEHHGLFAAETPRKRNKYYRF